MEVWVVVGCRIGYGLLALDVLTSLVSDNTMHGEHAW